MLPMAVTGTHDKLSFDDYAEELQGELNKEVTYWMDGSVDSILVTLNNNIITFATNTDYITGKNITLIIF